MTKQELGPLQKEWLAALRSGKYKQGRLHLHDTEYGTWCCLGVLCDLNAGRCGVNREIVAGRELFGNCATGLPEGIQVYTRMRTAGGIPAQRPDLVSLIAYNDIEDKSFDEIAETNPEAYFKGPA